MKPCYCEDCKRRFDIDEKPFELFNEGVWYCKPCGRLLTKTTRCRPLGGSIWQCPKHGDARFMCPTGLRCCPYCTSSNVHPLCGWEGCDYASCQDHITNSNDKKDNQMSSTQQRLNKLYQSLYGGPADAIRSDFDTLVDNCIESIANAHKKRLNTIHIGTLVSRDTVNEVAASFSNTPFTFRYRHMHEATLISISWSN